MATEKYAFGGLVFEIRTPRPLLSTPIAEEFRISTAREGDFIWEIRDEELRDPLRPVRVERDGKILWTKMDASLLPGISVLTFLSAAGAACLLPGTGRFMLHAAYVLHEGQAILFAAPGGTGKSTQARFWRDHRGARIVNEDRVILSREDGGFYAHGAWATGTAGVTGNVSAPVRAVVLLGQGGENRITHPGAGEKLRRLLPLCTFREGAAAEQIRIIDRVGELIEKVPVVAFDCLKDPSAVDILEGAI